MDDLDANPDSHRIHFIDNLRTTLVVMIIIQHSIIETASLSYPRFHSTSLAAFVLFTKTTAPGLFFLVSGFSSYRSRTPSGYYKTGRSDAEFLWRKSVRLLLPGLVYGVVGHMTVWMLLTKTWPTIFMDTIANLAEETDVGPPGEPQMNRFIWSFARLEGPVTHVLSLYLMDVAYVYLSPGQQIGHAIPSKEKPPIIANTRKPRFAMMERCSPRIKSRRDWNLLLASMTLVLSLWTFLLTASGRLDKQAFTFPFGFSSYDAISPVAPFQYISAYAFGARLSEWKHEYILTPPRHTILAVITTISISLATFILGVETSLPLKELMDLNNPWPIRPSFVDGGLNPHTLFYAVWSTLTFFATTITVVALYMHSPWTNRNWGLASKHSYFPAWAHIVFVAMFAKMLGAATDPGVPDISFTAGWRSILVATSSVASSWVSGLLVAAIGRILSR